jgi:hypothetical protein
MSPSRNFIARIDGVEDAGQLVLLALVPARRSARQVLLNRHGAGLTVHASAAICSGLRKSPG